MANPISQYDAFEVVVEKSTERTKSVNESMEQAMATMQTMRDSMDQAKELITDLENRLKASEKESASNKKMFHISLGAVAAVCVMAVTVYMSTTCPK